MNILNWKKEKKGMMKLGFTVIETLVAVSILSLSILAGFTAVQNSLRGSINVKDQITSFFLIQDVLEYIKNVRDENALNNINGGSNNWLAGLSGQLTDPCYFGKACYIDTTTKTATEVLGGNAEAPVIRMDSASGLWGYTGSWTATNFKRVVSFESISAYEVAVTVWISWTQGGDTKSFEVVESVFKLQ